MLTNLNALLIVGLILICNSKVTGQSIELTGKVSDVLSFKPIEGMGVQLSDTALETVTDSLGYFVLELSPDLLGEHLLRFEREDYQNLILEVVLYGKSLHIDPILIQPKGSDNYDPGLIEIAAEGWDELDEAVSIPAVLSAQKDVLSRASAFDFGLAFFRPRGLDTRNRSVLINGLEMNTFETGRPQWSYWGGLNDAHRQVITHKGMRPGEMILGGLGGTDDLVMRAGSYRKGGRLAYSAANRSYTFRLMGSYFTGKIKGGWSFAFTGSIRQGASGYTEGTSYRGRSIFIGIEKEFGMQQRVSLGVLYTPIERGISSALTQEVLSLKGNRYNPNWGVDIRAERNSRERMFKAPFLMINHWIKLGPKTELDQAFAFRSARFHTSRIDNGGTTLAVTSDGQEYYLGGGRNTLPNYYQRMPSYFLRTDPGPADFQRAWQAQEVFVTDGQLDWHALREANVQLRDLGRNALYIVGADSGKSVQWWLRSTVRTSLSDSAVLSGSLNWRKLTEERFGEVLDLLGGQGFLDIDTFAEEGTGSLASDVAQSDLRNRNRVVQEGERYKYNYRIYANQFKANINLGYSYRSLELFAAIGAELTSFQREGLYENGHFPGQRSYGKGDPLDFLTGGFKGGGVFQFDPNNAIEMNGTFISNPPTIRNTYANPRQNNDAVEGIGPVVMYGADLNYLNNRKWLDLRMSTYYFRQAADSRVAYYYTEQLAGLGLGEDAFVQEVTTGIQSQFMGLELSASFQLNDEFSVRLAGVYGRHTYVSDPYLYLTSDDFEGRLSFGDGKADLKGLSLANGPQRAYQVGFTYNSSQFWWLSGSFNYLSHSYIDPSRLVRSGNFRLDYDGLQVIGYDQSLAKELLKQERLPAVAFVNLVGGKSWRINGTTLGLFVVANNILGREFITGGYEQSRYSTYHDLKRDVQRPYGRLFGPRYFSGPGFTYFINTYLRF